MFKSRHKSFSGLVFQSLILSLFALNLCGCSGNDVDTQNQSINEFEIIKTPFNPNGGFEMNPVTGDSVETLPDSFATGVPILIDQSKLKTSLLGTPRVEQANPTKSLELPGKPVQVTPKIINPEHQFNILIPGEDTLEMPVEIPITGYSQTFNYPSSYNSSLPSFKDDGSYDIRYLDERHGLGDAYVRTVFTDSRGEVWFGTYHNGAVRYDGEKFTVYGLEEEIGSSKIRGIDEDSQGNLWFAADGGGITKYDGQRFTRYTTEQGLPTNSFLSILVDKNDNVWLGTSEIGVIKLDPKKGTFTNYNAKHGQPVYAPWALTEDSKGNIWIGGYTGGAVRFDGKSFMQITTEHGLPYYTVLDIIEDRSGNMWFATERNGACMFDGNYLTVYTEEEGLPNGEFWTVYEDIQGDIWFGTWGHGLIKYSRSDLSGFYHYTTANGLSNDFITGITEDDQGHLWITTYGGGVSVFNKNGFQNYTTNEGLERDIVMGIFAAQDTSVWVSTYQGGIAHIKHFQMNIYGRDQGFRYNYTNAICEDGDGNIWFGLTNGELCRYDGNHFTWYEGDYLLSGETRALFCDSKGRIWKSNQKQGVQLIEPSGTIKTFTSEDYLIDNVILHFIEDNDDNIWMINQNRGLSKFDGETITHYTEKEGLLNNYSRSVKTDQSGRIWIGSEFGGLSLITDDSIYHYTLSNGLPNNNVMSIEIDQKGNLWLGTKKGLCQMVIQLPYSINNPGFFNYGLEDGLKANDFFANSSAISPDNKLWMGSGKSLTILNLNDYAIPKETPRVKIYSLDLNDNKIDFRNDSNFHFEQVEAFYNYPTKLELEPNYNHLTFHFGALDWRAPHKIEYSFKLEGLNDQWSKPNRETKADYRNLSYGTYTFNVKARGITKDWSETIAYSFTILPPWYHTWWARVFFFIAGILLVLTIIRWRTAQLKKRQKELEATVEKRTYEVVEEKKEVERQKHLVEEKNTEILDSINYAKRIQAAILPSDKHVQELLRDAFILYLPKDVVAGDFYWMDAVYPAGDNVPDIVFFAAADCTGHGVPGAMVSVVCNNALNRSIHEFGLTDPGLILDKTREIVTKEFQKSDNKVKDGMDISLGVYHRKNKILRWAGANNPLWIIRNGSAEIEEIKADKQPIGEFEHASAFTTHEIQLKKGDQIYMFSDGFVDQFGGDKGKKFKAKNLKSVLLEMVDLSCPEKKSKLEETFYAWKGNLDQVDDVCIIGAIIE